MSSKWDKELEEQRTRRRKEVLEASSKLFLERDFPKVTMRDIASEVGISTVTLYKYYKSIDEIAFEVQQQFFLEMGEFFGGFSEDIPAYEQILVFLKNWLDLLKTKGDILRFQALFDHYYRTQYPEILQARSMQDMIRRGAEYFQQLFERGQSEGSIRTDIKVIELIAWTLNNLMAMAHRLAARGHLLEKETFVSTERMMEMTIESIITYIKKS